MIQKGVWVNKPEYDFVTNKGTHIKMKWFEKLREYRAFKVMKYGYVDIKLGSMLPEPLKRYIMENY